MQGLFEVKSLEGSVNKIDIIEFNTFFLLMSKAISKKENKVPE